LPIQPNEVTLSKTQQTESARWYEQFKFVCFLIGLVAVLLLAIHWILITYSPKHIADSYISFLFKEAGMAGLIALFLHVSIEWITRRREQLHRSALISSLEEKHQQTSNALLIALDEKHRSTSAKLLDDVNQQLFRTVYKRNIAPAVFEQVEKHLLRSDIMRKDFSAYFEIRPFIDPQTKASTQFVELYFCNEYVVQNLTDSPIEAEVVRAIVDVTPIYRDQCYLKQITLGEETIDKEALIGKGYVQQVENRNLIKAYIKRTIVGNDAMRVRFEYVKLAPIDYSEIVITTLPMDGLVLEVNNPTGSFTIGAVSLHPEDAMLLTPEDRQHLQKWKIDHAILPGQGIALMWHPNKKD
jgi:hypothetical protein